MLGLCLSAFMASLAFALKSSTNLFSFLPRPSCARGKQLEFELEKREKVFRCLWIFKVKIVEDFA